MIGYKRVRVLDIVGPLCVSADDGQLVHDAIVRSIKDEAPVSLSFDGVTTLISAFLNAAIGQLYGEFSEEQIRKSLRVEALGQDDLALLKRVVDNAKIYFANRKGFDEAWEREADDEE